MLVHDPALGNPTLLVLTDRNDLDNQLFTTFSRCAELLGQAPQQVTEVAELRHRVAETDALYLDRGVYGPDAVATSRFGEDGWSLDLDAVEVPDPDDAAVEAAVAEALAAQAPPASAQPQPRADAAKPGALCVLVPAADAGLAAAVEQAIGQSLVVEREPHVTVLYLGRVDEADVPEAVAAVTEAVAQFAPAVIERGVVRAFPPGGGGSPIVVEFEDGWRLAELNERLLRRLAHLVRAKQHARYRVHLTLGYAPSPLDAAALARLLEVDASAVRVPVVQLQVMLGGTVVATVPVGG
jgi:2'-5' RNA ligase